MFYSGCAITSLEEPAMKLSRAPFVLSFLLCTQTVQAQPQAAIVSSAVDASGKITIRLRAPKAEKVTLSSGDLQSTLGVPLPSMAKDDSGVWSVAIGPVPPGIYDYTFLVDGLSPIT